MAKNSDQFEVRLISYKKGPDRNTNNVMYSVSVWNMDTDKEFDILSMHDCKDLTFAGASHLADEFALFLQCDVVRYEEKIEIKRTLNKLDKVEIE